MADNQPNPEPTISNANAPEPIEAPVWSQHIPTDLKDKGYWEPVKNEPLSTVLKNYGNAQERMGRSITIPTKADDKDGWNTIYKQMGRPDEAKDYKYDVPVIEGIKWEGTAFEKFNGMAHQLGLSNEQVKGMVGWFTGDLRDKMKANANADNEAAAVTEVKLKRELGNNYDMKLALAKRAGQHYFGDETTTELFGEMNENVVRGLMKLGGQLAEDKVFGDSPVEMKGAVSKEEALKQINVVMGDRTKPYWGDPRSPLTQDALKEMENLHKAAYPEATVSG